MVWPWALASCMSANTCWP